MLFFLFQNLKNQIMTTNVWVEQVSTLSLLLQSLEQTAPFFPLAATEAFELIKLIDSG